ncbi:bifunctional diaminohydroxyphosphoribosylaminopyrimidine deaminase/5-amino-6-(5-phosphoribosylamino)uracil reductase RibD [Desulfobotulus sp.]|jgi:diaminohydroxyphosphoribosylaminopyrimidine deaminase/5-amino-6-(5-phosphoribosylamino)uracil reductase|uniref:bifunctional diaminohydroxyphosphoribosylaminopyrimidine deaminase/5-amino-6-(5-phosphoribosylamino)uracil reductase RibD n=1 Tax=Desulfobotulus sp. TaxID=1940337 RepID=UPI002A361240|nr:bifunctional diaminohydroxyphosphoribosylaminopyrimidine deaminase/5-amino-6-(5-phosphoribosylamino)uracil reductase RibD [Desulfobotulus sp.]MDY0163161.1 bifunctional diaminohydroxyphosphoribosylaminopyrimidine deaminase/5-amino-6-(5-phosphoribosylamino)uracil reductase RibD [Desulfobotulus sp.]
MNDLFFMERALELAERGAGRTSPNPLVGALVVKDGKVVGEGWHEAYGGPHAEVHALAAAGDGARGATIYVTLEPCNHYGKTPPCTEAILKAGIRRVVMAMADPNPKAAGGQEKLRAAGLTVEVGLCEEKARKLNAPFLKMVETGLPYVVLKCAMTLDGRVATRSGDSKWVTGSESREWCHRYLRQRLDAILVGSATVRADDPSLTCRLPEGGGRDPLRIVLASTLDISPDAQVLRQKSDSATVLVCAEGTTAEKKVPFLEGGAEILELPRRGEGLDMQGLLPLLARRRVQSLLIEGGGRVAASALRSGIVDHVVFFYAPKILGGDGIPVLDGPGPQRMAQSLVLEGMEVFRTGEDIRVEGRPLLPPPSGASSNTRGVL